MRSTAHTKQVMTQFMVSQFMSQSGKIGESVYFFPPPTQQGLNRLLKITPPLPARRLDGTTGKDPDLAYTDLNV